MSAAGSKTGIDLVSLQDGFSGSEDILAQMLGLFETQARERMVQLTAALEAWDVMAARQCLHSLVNISGAVHAYGMSELTKTLGDAVKLDQRAVAETQLQALRRETDLVLRQVSVLLGILALDPASVWGAILPE